MKRASVLTVSLGVLSALMPHAADIPESDEQ